MTPILNPREFLVLAVAKMVPPSEGQAYARDANGKPLPVVGIDLYEILAFDFTPDGLPEPISVVGKPRFDPGATYAIFDRRDKSYTLLSGERIGDYKAFSALVEKRAEAGGKWARGGAETGLGDAEGSGSSGDTGAPAPAPVGGLAAGPKPWRDVVPRWGV